MNEAIKTRQCDGRNMELLIKRPSALFNTLWFNINTKHTTVK